MKKNKKPVLGEQRLSQDITGRLTYLEERDDLNWAFEVHINGKPSPHHESDARRFTAHNTGSIILVGNEDAPEQIWATYDRPAVMASKFELLYQNVEQQDE